MIDAHTTAPRPATERRSNSKFGCCLTPLPPFQLRLLYPCYPEMGYLSIALLSGVIRRVEWPIASAREICASAGSPPAA